MAASRGAALVSEFAVRAAADLKAAASRCSSQSSPSRFDAVELSEIKYTVLVKQLHETISTENLPL